MPDIPEDNIPHLVVPLEVPNPGTAPPGPQRWKLPDLFFFLAFAVLWLLLAPLAAYMGYAVLRPLMGWRVRTQTLPENAFFAVVTQTIYYVPLLAYVYFLIVVHYRQAFWTGLKWGGLSLPRVMRCLMGGIALSAFTLVALALLPDKQSFPLEQLFTSRRAAYLVGGFAVLVAPFMEELIFRGVLFSFFENLVGLRFAVVSTALLFAGLHVPEYWGAWHHAALILLVGVVFSVARGLTGSLAPSVILHFAYNTTLMTGLFIGSQHFREIQGVLDH
jgi:membrane protease YdiL (CAAX protease family)